MDTQDSPARLTADDIGTILRAAWTGTPADAPRNDAETTVFLALRGAGRRLAAKWAVGAGPGAAIAAALAAARAALSDGDSPDHVELCIVETRESVAGRDRGKAFSFLRRGVVGAEIRLDGNLTRVAPTEIIASNRKYSRVIQTAIDSHGLSDAQAAMREAWEEAGVRTSADKTRPVGQFFYDKSLEDGSVVPIVAHLYKVRVRAGDLADSFPEAGQRKRVWVPAKKAAKLVREPELKAVLRSL